MSIRVLLVDDHKIMLEGLRLLIESQTDMEVVGEAENGRKAVLLAGQLKPDVVIMDVRMPEMNGIDATCRIISNQPDIKVVALSMDAGKHSVVNMLKAGATGYILKDNAFKELTLAVKTVLANNIYLSKKISYMAVDDYTKRLKTNNKLYPVLTDREVDVLRLIAAGKSSKEIALQLGRSSKTIDASRRQIMHKLGIDNLAELIKYTIREGYASLDE